MRRRLAVASLVLGLSLGAGGSLAAGEEPSASGAFEAAGSLGEARVNHAATLLPDGRIFVVGGFWGEGFLASAEVWDPATASFESAGSLSEARQFHTATLLPNGRILVVGGFFRDASNSIAFIASAEVWDPATESFGPAGSLAEARGFHAATLLADGRVVVVGGGGGDIPHVGGDLGPGDGILRPRRVTHRGTFGPHRHAPGRRPRLRRRWLLAAGLPRLGGSLGPHDGILRLGGVVG
jgi:hypothetical protein